MDYQSSENVQRAYAQGVFIDGSQEQEKQDDPFKDKVIKVLDKYIDAHKFTDSVRRMAKANGRTADQQLDLSADLVEILEKIKKEVK